MERDVITDVVFDFCGVLIDWQWGEAMKRHAPDWFLEHLDDPDDPYGFFRYEDRMDAGELLADIMPDIVAEQGQEIADLFDYYIAHYDDALPNLIPGVESLLRDLRDAGVRIWGLTNWSSETFHYAFELYPQLEELLSGTVVSGIEKLHKPEAAIYEHAQRRFHLVPEQTMFFDDTARNVQGALDCGWNACRFTSADGARKALRDHGVTV